MTDLALPYEDRVHKHWHAVVLHTTRRFDVAQANRLDWSAPSPVCVAGSFGLCEEAVARQLGGKVDPMRLVRFGKGPILLQGA